MCVKLLHANGIRMDTNRLIYFYFSMGLTYEEIIKQRDINDAVSVWNTHRIRPTRNDGQSGKPCILYCLYKQTPVDINAFVITCQHDSGYISRVLFCRVKNKIRRNLTIFLIANTKYIARY